jgi:hypothetical protein
LISGRGFKNSFSLKIAKASLENRFLGRNANRPYGGVYRKPAEVHNLFNLSKDRDIPRYSLAAPISFHWSMAVQRKGVCVTAVSTLASKPPIIAKELRRQVDHFVDMRGLLPLIQLDQV